jgi:hypothetical protein
VIIAEDERLEHQLQHQLLAPLHQRHTPGSVPMMAIRHRHALLCQPLLGELHEWRPGQQIREM